VGDVDGDAAHYRVVQRRKGVAPALTDAQNGIAARRRAHVVDTASENAARASRANAADAAYTTAQTARKEGGGLISPPHRGSRRHLWREADLFAKIFLESGGWSNSRSGWPH
jgi:hypothetical protein